MKRTILLSIFISLSFITVLAQQPPPPAPGPEWGTWINVAPANSGFSVLMPAKPSEKVEAVEGHPGIDNRIMMLDTKLAGYVVSYTQFPDEITDSAAIKRVLDSGREGGIASGNGKLKSEKDIRLNEYLGREWLLELPGGFSATARAYWVKRRLYQIVFVWAANASDTPEAMKFRQEMSAKFLDSFSLTEDAK